MRWLLSLLLTFLHPLPSQAAFEFLDVAARPVAMGGAFCALADDANGPEYNPAGMSWSQGRKVTLSACRPFGLADVAVYQACLLQPTSWGTLSLRARQFGGDLYREMTVGLGYARPLREDLSLGFCLRGLQLAIRGYGSDQTWSLDLGFLAAPTDRLRWGMSALNVNNGRLGSSRESLPQVMIMGIAWRPHSRLLLCADLLEDIADRSLEEIIGGYPVELRLGQESRLWASLILRLGLHSHPTQFSVGLGLEMFLLRLDYAYRSHQFLGGTHHISLSWPPSPGSAEDPHARQRAPHIDFGEE